MSQLFHDDACGAGKMGRVCIATTAYDNPDANYTYSIQSTREALHKAGYATEYILLTGNCHVDDARNTVLQAFLASQCTDLVFIDADVSWQPQMLLRLLSKDADIVGGVYPFRREDKGLEMPVRMMTGAEPRDDGLIEVEGLPTGFMRIRRRVIEEMAKVSPSFTKDELVIPLLFERTLEQGTRWGGDLNFCNKWRGMGGKVYADYEMRLGHTAKVVLRGSLAATIRRRQGVTLRHVCEKIAAGEHTLADLTEAREYVDNGAWGALEDVLAAAVALAGRSDGPIIEAGSGLTTILMAAAAPKQTVYCLEHHGLWAAKLRQMAAEARITNIGLCVQPMTDGWYDIGDLAGTIPNEFALGLNDGPPRQLGSRMGFFDHFDPKVILCDDADAPGYRRALVSWAETHQRQIDFIEPRAAIISRRAA